MLRLGRPIALVLALLFGMLPLVFAGAPAAQAQAGAVDSVVIVLDVSGSMNQASGTEPGKSRLDVAKEAVTAAVDQVAAGSINLGLRTFARCGSNLVVPLGPADPGAFNDRVGTIRAGGSTGIEVALRAAVADLGTTTGNRTVMLISDGVETCGGDPCAAAADLLANNVSFIVNAVGFQTAGTTAEQQLQCIADATGGTMTPVEDLPELFEVIERTVLTCTGSLIECYAPEVRFHPQETFFPMDPVAFIEGSELRWAHSADGFAPRTCWKDETIDDDPNALLLGQGAYSAQQEQHDPSFWNPRRCSNFGKDYTTIEYTRPFSETPSNVSQGDRVLTNAGSKLETQEGFMLSWKDYGPWYNPSDTPLGLSNNPGSGGSVQAPMIAQIVNGPNNKFIVYHMFYGFDPKSRFPGDGAFAHEGDWERLIVILDSNDRATEFRFEGHGCDTPGFRANNHVPASKMMRTDVPPTEPGTGQLVDGTHPVIYVAEGSHAAYPGIREAGPLSKACDAAAGFKSGQFDETVFVEGTSATWRPWEAGQIVEAQSQCWYGFGGAWGRSGDVLSLIGRADDTGPAGPHWNIPDLPTGNSCGGKQIRYSPGKDSLAYGDTMTVSLSGYVPGTEVVLSLASIEIGMATAVVGGDGSASLTFQVPDGFEPGGHHVIVRATSNGDILSVGQANVVPPAECVIANAGISIAGDIDGDNLRDECDRFPTDGPAADFDGDGVRNFDDNCPRVPNPGQDALANSSVGIACDIDVGHNAALQIYQELTGSTPAPGTQPPLPDVPAATPTAEPIAYIEIENAPPSQAGVYGFGTAPNPQPASVPLRQSSIPVPAEPATAAPPAAAVSPAAAPVAAGTADAESAVSVPAAATGSSDTGPATTIANTGAESVPLALLGTIVIGLGSLVLGGARIESRRGLKRFASDVRKLRRPR